MASPGANFGDQIGGSPLCTTVALSGVTTSSMTALNTGWCARFIARDSRDIATVYVNWSAVTAAGVVELRIETIDATTGKPTGTLYDANATKAQAPVAGWQAFTFAALPTTGLTAGTEYGIVMLTTTAGTTHTLRSHITGTSPSQTYPSILLTAADGTTRTNFAEVATSAPCCTVVFEDGAEEPLEFIQWATSTTYNIFGTNASGSKIIVPANTTWNVRGIRAVLTKNGTPAGDLRVRIFNSSDAAVSGATCTVDKDSLSTGLASVRYTVFPFAAPVALTAGTYRAVFDSASSANSSNCWRQFAPIGRSSAVVDSGHIMTSTADVTAVPPITWTDTATEEPTISLLLDTVSASGGTSGMLYIPCLNGT